MLKELSRVRSLHRPQSDGHATLRQIEGYKKSKKKEEMSLERLSRNKLLFQNMVERAVMHNEGMKVKQRW